MRGLGGGFHGGRGGGVPRPSGRLPMRTTRRAVRLPARSLPQSREFAVLGLTPFASRSDVKRAYKRLALKYHPDVIRADSGVEKEEAFKEIKSAYESLMVKFEEAATPATECHDNDWEEWEEWMGFEGGIPVVHNPL